MAPRVQHVISTTESLSIFFLLKNSKVFQCISQVMHFLTSIHELFIPQTDQPNVLAQGAPLEIATTVMTVVLTAQGYQLPTQQQQQQHEHGQEQLLQWRGWRSVQLHGRGRHLGVVCVVHAVAALMVCACLCAFQGGR